MQASVSEGGEASGASLGAFLREFINYAGAAGLRAAGLVLSGAVLEGLGLVLLVPLLGLVMGGGHLPHAATAAFSLLGADSAFARLAAMLSMFSVLMIVRAVLLRARDVSLLALQLGFVEMKRFGIVRMLAGARWDQVAGLKHARVTHLMSADIQRISQAANFILQCATALVMLAAQAVLALWLSPPLAVISFALLGISAFALLPLLRRARTLGAFLTNANLQLLNSTAQFLGGLKLAISQNLQESFVSEFKGTLNEITHRQISNTRQQSTSRVALATLSALVGAALILIGFGAFHLSPPVLIALLLVISRMSGPAGQVQMAMQQVAFALPAYAKVKELEADLVQIAPLAPRSALAFPEGAITFDRVTFLHVEDGEGGEKPRGVRELSLSIAPTEFVGIAGPSGAGKTTFADLLVGLYPPQAGRVSVGTKPLQGDVLDAWRNGLAYVSQDPFMFHDTLRRNLLWARPDATEAELRNALSLAGAEELVQRMEEGLDTVMGERGTLVSGGERQRLALARALLRRPRVLVLDEATSAIDIAGERKILERLKALAPAPTIILIAHRQESLAYCDRVLEFRDGGVLSPEAVLQA
jgi:ATP-binding cassette subfamily C protein